MEGISLPGILKGGGGGGGGGEREEGVQTPPLLTPLPFLDETLLVIHSCKSLQVCTTGAVCEGLSLNISFIAASRC